MPNAPLAPCRAPGCPVLGPCATHDATLAREARPYWDGWYRLARWRRLRRQVLEACPLCVGCRLVGRIVASCEVDHIVPHRGDPTLFWDRTNLQALCHSCHSEKTGRGQ